MKAMVRLLVIGLMACGYCCPATFAQKYVDKNKDRYGYFLESGKKVLRIPFEIHSNLIIVPVQVNDSDTLRFVLDTGVSTTIITDPTALQLNQLQMTRKVIITGAGEGEPLVAQIAIGNTLRMEGMRANHQNIVLLEEDVLRLSEFVGLPVHGIFGYEVFNNFVVTIDFRHKELTLRAPGSYTYKKRKGELYPITIEDTKPFTRAVTLLADGREQPIKLAIDTGAGHALLLDRSSNSSIQLPEKLVHTQLGRGLNGVINGNLGRIEMVRVGKFELGNVVASFPDSTSFGMKLDDGADRQGNIGCELLRRFKVTMNYHDQYMVLKPVKRRLREKFEHDMSGMEIKAMGEDFKDIMITHVMENSPAKLAGLMEGDQLLFVNDRPIHELTMNEMYKLMQKGDGKFLDMLVKRQEEIFFTRIRLRRLI